MAEHVKLKLFSQSLFPNPVLSNLLTGCPTIDLSATVDDGSVLYVRRPNGELVSKHTERGQTVQAVGWKADGQSVAVGWSDGTVRLTSLENSKAVHPVRVCDAGSARIVYIAQSRNSSGRRRAGRGKPADGQDQQLWDSMVSGGLDVDGKGGSFDLPHELTFLEVDSALPKLSPLPVSGGSGDDMFVFTTRTSLEFVFQPFKSEDSDMVDVMMVGTDDGAVHLSIYDTFIIGAFRTPIPPAAGAGQPLVCGHASHPDLSTHSLILRESGDKPRAVYLVPVDLHFISSSPVNLPLLASKTTMLQKLLRYIKQTQIHMTGEWQSTRELPSRFLLGVQEDLQKSPKGPVDIVQALYHSVVTGHVYPVVKEWLVDSLAERGHKRWDKAVVSGLENLRALVHENMLPALERSAIILSRLHGLARFHGSSGGDAGGLGTTQIGRLMDITACLTLVSHKILLLVMEELDLFTTFSSWLRLEIDRAASSSSASEELSEKEATMDNAKVLAYIQRYLLASPLAAHLDRASQEDYNQSWEHCDGGRSLLDMLDKQLQRQEAGQPFMKALPQIGFLVAYLSKWAGSVFDAIAEAEKRSVRFDSPPTKMEIGEAVSKHEVRMCVLKDGDASGAATFTVLASDANPSDIYIFRTDMRIVNGISKAASTKVYGLSLGGGVVIDFKFLSDAELLVLWRPDVADTAIILRVPVQTPELAYAEVRAGNQDHALQTLGRDEVMAALSPMELPDAAAFRPMQMEVKQASRGRGDIPARVCVLGEDRVTYRVFAVMPDAQN